MSKITKGLMASAIALTLGLGSCSDDSPWRGSSEEGGISLDLSTDGRVVRSTRADDSQSPVVPQTSAFGVKLEKSDGSFSKSWNSIDAFNREQSFAIGDYSLTAFYGDIDVEGFTAPYYKGTADVHVSPGAETQALVVATLANAMVSVRYTDEFIDNFPQYSAAVQTEGHDWVVFAQTETRPAYVAPSEVKLNLTLTNDAGDKVTIQPASFTAAARHHYIVTIGVTGNAVSGNLALDVQFEEDVVAETVAVSLGDELFNAPAPTIEGKGFTAGSEVKRVEYASMKDNMQFDVFAFGGIHSAVLTVVSSDYTPAFGGSVELVNASPLTQQQLASEGIDASGFYRNVDKMGVVNVTRFLQGLPAGKYAVELQVVDKMTRTSEPLALSAEVSEMKMEFLSPEKVGFMAEEVAVELASNCADIKENVVFTAPNASNQMKEVAVKSVSQITSSDASLPYAYKYVLAIDPQVRAGLDVKASFGKRTATTVVPMEMPECTVTTDAFARKVMLKMDIIPASLASDFIDHLVFYNGASQIPTSNVNYDATTGIVTIAGLSPKTTYSSIYANCVNYKQTIPAFTTEPETPIVNGDFSSIAETLNISPINVGGKFNVKVGIISADYQITSSILYSTPTGWANVNANTCWNGSSNKNSWYLVPSTYSQNGATVLRSVGYNHAGPALSTSGGQMNTNYYCETVPASSNLEKCAGELFLGSYAFTGSESRVDGIAWTTRPSSLTFDYTYAPVNNEQAEAYVSVLDASGAVIASGVKYLSAASAVTSVSVPLSGYAFGKKAAKIQVGFRSTKAGVTPAVNIPTGDSLSEGIANIRGNLNIPANTYHALATGSVLTIDNVALGYSGSQSVAASKPRTNGKKK